METLILDDIMNIGFGIGKNALNEAVMSGDTPEKLSLELNQLRYAAIFVLASLIFNEELLNPGIANESISAHVDVIKQTMDDLVEKYERGEMVTATDLQKPESDNLFVKN